MTTKRINQALRVIAMSAFIALLTGCTTVATECPECDGDGKVYYGPDHPIVEMGFEVGEYECPMCGGSGDMERER